MLSGASFNSNKIYTSIIRILLKKSRTGRTDDSQYMNTVVIYCIHRPVATIVLRGDWALGYRPMKF